MDKLIGIAAAPGIALGPGHLYGWRIDVRERRIDPDGVAAELARLERAVAASEAQIEQIQRQIAADEGPAHQHYQILEAHRLMFSDPHLVGEARRLVREELHAAEWAVRCALNQIRVVFERIQDPYFRERGSDVEAVGNRILGNLQESVLPGRGEIPPGAIVYGHDFSPADVTQLGRAGVAGLVSEVGGKSSHSAVVARALGLPLVVGVRGISDRLRLGLPLIVDGSRGEVILDPGEEARAHYASRAARSQARDRLLQGERLAPAQTQCGRAVELAANVELLEEVGPAIDLGAAGVGLFRTEFLYLDRDTLPTEDEQYQHLVAAIGALGGRPATFRTLDLGGDKLPAGLRVPVGVNPALGLRSIRFSLRYRDVFRAQLRALYRAAARGPMRILFPLVSGLEELRAARAICEEVQHELARAGVEHRGDVPLGVMIETPSAALIAELLASECDFLSIGTNDLIQYTLAVDRQDEQVGYLYDPFHPAILRSLRGVVEACARAGKSVAMCGDMAGDPSCTWILLGLGLSELSMAPRQIPFVKSVVRRTVLEQARALAAEALRMRTGAEVGGLVAEVMSRTFPELEDVEREAIVP